jgi:hypothetical protein
VGRVIRRRLTVRQLFAELKAVVTSMAATQNRNVAIHKDLGAVYEKAGKSDLAEREFAKCRELDLCHCAHISGCRYVHAAAT